MSKKSVLTGSIKTCGLLLLFAFNAIFSSSYIAQPQSPPRRLKVALLDFGEGKTAERITNVLAARLESSAIEVVNRDLARAAAHGVGYQRSFNMSLSEARDLGAAIGCDFFMIGDAQTLRRSASTGAPYFESYVSMFLVSSRSGKLLSWQRPSFEAGSPDLAEQQLLTMLQKDELPQSYQNAVVSAAANERLERQLALERNLPVIEEVSDEKTEATSTRNPRPYRRFKPVYPDSAARADAAGTVDVVVDLDKDGEVMRADIARWAGFGMDEAALDTVRRLHFFPAMRDGVAIPVRVLLRYNFKRPN